MSVLASMAAWVRAQGELPVAPDLGASAQPILGKTLPEVLDQACDRRPNKKAFNQFHKGVWKAVSNQSFCSQSQTIGRGLKSLGLEKGDRVAVLMRSDLNFAIADLACAQAGLVSVPINLTETLANIAFILEHSAAKVLLISNLDLLYQLVPQLWEVQDLQTIVVVDVPSNWPEERRQKLQCSPGYAGCAVNCPTPGECLCLPLFEDKVETERDCPIFPQCIRTLSWAELQAQAAELELDLPVALSPQDVATILYTPVGEGELKGVMLSHENLSANALTAFRDSEIAWGTKERALSFLPLTHVFARVLFYGHIYYGHSLYFSSPSRVLKHLRAVKPTIFATVPLLLEKTYSKLQELSQARPVQESLQPEQPHLRQYFHSLKRRLLPQGLSASVATRLLAWGLRLAQQEQTKEFPPGRLGLLFKVLHHLEFGLADWFVFRRWRSQFGGQLSIMLCGGAPLRPEVARVFSAAGFPLHQGYGLTQTSSVIAYNRGQKIRADTVGQPAVGADIRLAEDGEVLVRGPFVMQGYFKDEAATQAAIDGEGWFHTGDRGQFDGDGFLSITGSKKSLFKLATGKYVVAEALEREVRRSPLVAHAVAVGRGRKFCGMLIFPDFDALQPELQSLGKAEPLAQLLQHPDIHRRYQAWLEEVNLNFPKWSQVKRFQVINGALSGEDGSLKLDASQAWVMDRDAIAEIYAQSIADLYQAPATGARQGIQAVLPSLPQPSDAVAQPSLESPLFPMPPSSDPSLSS